MVTNMRLFKIFYISFLFFNSSLFAGLNTIEQNDLIIKKNEDSIIEKHDSNQKILIDGFLDKRSIWIDLRSNSVHHIFSIMFFEDCGRYFWEQCFKLLGIMCLDFFLVRFCIDFWKVFS